MAGLLSETILMWFIVVLLLSQAGAIFLLYFNISRRRKAEKSLVSSEKLFRQIVNSSPIGICIISDRKFQYVNTAYLTMFGYDSEDEILGRPVEELYAPEEGRRQRQYARDRSAGKPVPTTYDTIGLKKDGTRFDVTAWVSIIEFRDKVSSLGFVVDRSVEKDLRKRLDHSNRLEAIGTLAGGIAHDFNNILTAIIGYAELAHLQSQGNDAVCRDLRQVLSAGHRAKGLVLQILTFSRNQERQLELVQLSAVVDEVIELVRASLPTSIEIRLNLYSDTTILGDPVQIHQLLMNLCTNAQYELRGKSGILEITLEDVEATQEDIESFPNIKPGEYVRLTVADNGPGIPEEIREKIFEPFFTTKQTGEGTGMGLSQVHGIVANHCGYIKVDNRVPNGAVFTILLPIPEHYAVEQTDVCGDMVGGNERILVVDDEEAVAQVSCRILSELGYRVVENTDSLKALSMFRLQPDEFDLVLSDLTMPHLTGDKLAEAMLRIRPEIPVILCSGYRNAIDDVRAKRIGIKALLEKPVEKEILAATIRNVLDQR